MLSYLKSNGWNISERGYRSLLRGLFVFVVLMPTFVIGALVSVASTDWYREMRRVAWQNTLQQELGVAVSIGSISETSPGHFMAHEVKFRHPETGEHLASIKTIAGQKRSDSWEVELFDPTIETENLAQFWHSVHDWKIRRPSSKRRVIQVVSKRLHFVNGVVTHQFADLKFSYASQPDESRAKLSMLPDWNSNLKPIELCLRRIHLGNSVADVSIDQSSSEHSASAQSQLQNLAPFTTRVIVDAANCELPLALMLPFLGSAFPGDTQATIDGLMYCDLTQKQDRFSLYSGTIRNVRLEQAQAILPFEITGSVAVHLDVLKMVNNQIVELQSKISGRDIGEILDVKGAYDFFAENNIWLNDLVLESQPKSIAFRNLELGLRVDERGVTLSAAGKSITEGETVYRIGMIYELAPQHCVLFQTEKRALTIEQFADLYPNSTLPNDRLPHRRRVLAHLSYPLDTDEDVTQPIIARSAADSSNRVASAENSRRDF